MAINYTPADAEDEGSLPDGVIPVGLTWDGQQLVIVDQVTVRQLWTLARNSDGTYTPANAVDQGDLPTGCLLYTSPSPRDRTRSRMPSSA